jgi:hypothetical protein
MTTALQTRVAGIFVFWPLLAQLGFDELVKRADYPGSGMVPATSALLGLLALKLIDKERRSHISDFNFRPPDLGEFATLPDWQNHWPPRLSTRAEDSCPDR